MPPEAPHWLILLAATAAGALALAARWLPQLAGLRAWSLALALGGLAATLDLHPVPLPTGWRALPAALALLASQWLWIVGALRLLGRPRPGRWLAVVAAASFLPLALAPWLEARGALDALLATLVAGLRLGLAGRLLAALPAGRPRVLAATAGVLLLAEAVLHVAAALPGAATGAGWPRWTALALDLTCTTPLLLLLALDRLAAGLEQAALRDPLTGLRNRDGFFTSLDPLLAHARRHRGHAAVMMLDIDHFRRLNERFGHAVGDEVLRRMGRTLAQTLRGSDLAVRWGGQEFCAVLIHTDGVGAHTTAERVRRGFAEQCREIEALRGGKVSVSVGIAYGPLDRNDFDALQQRADRALRAAKEAGRDQVSAAIDPSLRAEG